MFLSEWREFPSAPFLTGNKILMTARVSMLLKSRMSLTCSRAYFLPGRAKDLSASRYNAQSIFSWSHIKFFVNDARLYSGHISYKILNFLSLQVLVIMKFSRGIHTDIKPTL